MTSFYPSRLTFDVPGPLSLYEKSVLPVPRPHSRRRFFSVLTFYPDRQINIPPSRPGPDRLNGLYRVLCHKEIHSERVLTLPRGSVIPVVDALK